MLYWISNSKCKIFPTCSRASADKLKKAQTPIFKTGFLCRLVDMFFSPVWDFFEQEKKKEYIWCLYFSLLLWNWEYQETTLEWLENICTKFWLREKAFVLVQKEIGQVKNTSEGQQQAFGKALYVSCRRYVEEKNEKLDKFCYCWHALIEGKTSQRYNEINQK